MYLLKIAVLLSFFLVVSCASVMKSEKKVEFDLESPNVRIEKFPQTFNLKGKGTVLTNCAANNCSPEVIAKMDAGAMKNFTKDGQWEEYIELENEDTKKKESFLWMKGIYKDGKKEGPWEEYEAKYDSATKTRKVVKKQFGDFKDNKKEGVWTLLAETGEKLKETPYVAGKKHGTEKKYSLKGTQTEETNYVEGEKHGSYWKKNSSSLAECEGSYTKEQKTGTWTEYAIDEKGSSKLKAVIPYVKDKREGLSVFYQPDGQAKQSEGNYKDNYKVGVWKQFYPSGSIESEGMRKPLAGEEAAAKEQESLCPGPNLNGKSVNSGEWKKYYQSGDLFSVGAYDDKGLPTKEWKFYYKGMKLRCKGTMSNSIMMQNGELYDKSGAIEGKGNMMLSMFSIDDKTDEMKDKMIPALPFTYYKSGKKYLEILPSNKSAEPSGEEAKTEGEEVRKETIANEYDASGAKIGSGPYMFIPTQPFGGKKHGCWTEGGKKVSYLMGRVQTGRMAEMSNCK